MARRTPDPLPGTGRRRHSRTVRGAQPHSLLRRPHLASAPTSRRAARPCATQITSWGIVSYAFPVLNPRSPRPRSGLRPRPAPGPCPRNAPSKELSLANSLAHPPTEAPKATTGRPGVRNRLRPCHLWSGVERGSNFVRVSHFSGREGGLRLIPCSVTEWINAKAVVVSLVRQGVLRDAFAEVPHFRSELYARCCARTGRCGRWLISRSRLNTVVGTGLCTADSTTVGSTWPAASDPRRGAVAEGSGRSARAGGGCLAVAASGRQRVC